MYQKKFLFLILTCFFISGYAQDYDFSNNSDARFRYKEIGGGMCVSKFSHYHKAAKSLGSNSVNLIFSSTGPSSSPIYNYQYFQKYNHTMLCFGINFAEYFNFGNNRRFYYKSFISTGKDNDDDPEHRDNPTSDQFVNIMDLTFVPGIDIDWFGLEAGLHIGNNREWDQKTGNEPGSLTTGSRDLIPQFCGKLRLGNTNSVFFEARLGNPYFGFNGSKYPYTVGIGSGLGQDNGNILRCSVGLASQNSLVFMGGFKLHLINGYGAEVDLCFGDSQFTYFALFKYFGKRPMKEVKKN